MQSRNHVPVSEQIAKLGDICPQAIALSSGDQSLNYAQLNRQADQFAAYIAQRGAVPGSTVAICMERSFDWIVAALGIMRVGAAYLPLDPAWPDARLRFAINDSRATVLVARSTVISRLGIDAEGIDPTCDAQAISAISPNATARTPIALENLAYVIYTSGSMGTPKGVEITHANLCHLIRWHCEAFAVTPQDRASHLAGLGFDAAVWEIWPHLAAGTTLCLADDAARSSPELLQQWLIRNRVTIAFVPTIHASSLMAMSWREKSSLRLLLTGGDVLHRGPDVNLPFSVVNNYGPTECTVVSTSATLKPGSAGAPPIGNPITGATIYLLDEQRRPVPDGERGEIYIGGGGVGRGYRNLPDLTGQCFLPDPFAGAPHARMYRTGDFGIRQADGQIEFCGRRDRQAKIRGQRIELDEIGIALMDYSAVEFAVAVIGSTPEGENELVAHVLPNKNAPAPTGRELREHLMQKLPACMSPAKFVRLHELPLSPNGKIDLKILAPPTAENLLADDVIGPAAGNHPSDFANDDLLLESEIYWLKRIPTLPPPPNLPLLTNCSSVIRAQYRRRWARIRPEVWGKLAEKARHLDLAPAGVLLAAYAEVLTLWSKQPRFLLNLPLHSYDAQSNSAFVNLLAIDNTAETTFENRARQQQDQLRRDLKHCYFTGTRVMREITRNKGSRAVAPVVFTSLLDLGYKNEKTSWLGPLGGGMCTISQTPQVYLDCMVRKDGDALVLNWDAVDAMFPPGLLDDMFQAFCSLLEELAEEDSSWERSLAQNANRLLPSCQAKWFAEFSHTQFSHTCACTGNLIQPSTPQSAKCTNQTLDSLPARRTPTSAREHCDQAVWASSSTMNGTEIENAWATASPIEEKLLAMMREILRNNSVRAKDNFFLAGGHSLLAMQLVMRVRDVFGVDMTLRQLFEAPTVERLSLLIERTLVENISSMTDEEAEKQLIA
jgi:amino acid adenylation domain-containing protein